METSTETGALAGRKEYIGLAVLCLPTILVSLDLSVLFLALPHLAGNLGASSVQQLWITDIYGFVLSGLLVTMGRVGDRVGRKRLLLIGGTCFAVISVFAAYSSNPAMLITARALLGVAGSTIMPSTMALISVMFTNPKQHATAIGIWMGCFTAGSAFGPIVGGVLLQNFWWGSVFLMGVPIMAILLVVGPKFLPEYRNPDAGRIDLLSVGMSLAAVLLSVYGLKQLARNGAGAVQIGALVVGLVIGYLFLRRQNRLESPLLDLGMFKNRTFRTALLMTMCAGLLSGNQLFVTFYLQSAQHLSPVATALWQVPSLLTMIIMIQVATAVVRKVKPVTVIAGGLVVAAVGYWLLTLAGGNGNLPLVVIGLVVIYLGIGPMAGLCATLAMQAAPPEKAGSAGALIETFGEFGVAMGVATVGVVGTALYKATIVLSPSLPAASAAAAHESIGGALTAASTLPPGESDSLLHSAFNAVATGLHGSGWMCAGIALAAAVMVVYGIRSVPPTGQPAADAGEQAAPDRQPAPETAG